MDLYDLFWSVITGLLSSIIIVGFYQSEDDRTQMNHSIKLLADEINWNRTKLGIYKKGFEKVKTQWEKNNILARIECHPSISRGYGDNIYNLFIFDAYHHFIYQGIHLDINRKLDYSIKDFYHKCMTFCLHIQQIENKIHEYHDSGRDAQISDKFKELEGEIDYISGEFGLNTFASSPGSEERDPKEIGWADWHLFRNRHVIYLFEK